MSDDKPNPFGAVLRKTGNKPEGDGGATSPKKENVNDKKDGGSPFGATLKPSGGGGGVASKFGMFEQKKDTDPKDKPNPFGNVLKKSDSGSSPVTKPAAAAAADAADKPNPFGAVLKSSKQNTPTATKPTTPVDTSLSPTSPAAAPAPAAGPPSLSAAEGRPVPDAAAAAAAPAAAETPAAAAAAAAAADAAAAPAAAEEKKPDDVAATSVAATTAVAAAAAPDAGALPVGWVEKKDEKSGKPYYYNKSTKETSWKRPEAAAPATATVAAADPNALPDGWVEKKDEKSGKPYYYNKSTKETSWKRPAAAAPATAAVADADPNALAEGWVEKKDEKSGKPYYYSKSTKETSWKRPENPAAAAAAVAAADPNALPEGWVEKKDEKSGKPYYYNKSTKETSWKRPENPAATAAAAAAVADEKPQHEEEQQPVLPEGWKEKKDPSTGKIFYFNKSTGETSWKFPGLKEKEQKAIDDKATAVIAAERKRADEEERLKYDFTPEQIMMAWREMEDERTSKKYYVNRVTAETSWTDPRQTNSFGVDRATLAAEGWGEADDALGQRYFFNLKTKEVSWTWPPTNVEGGAENFLSLPKTAVSGGGAGGGRQRGRSMVGGSGNSSPLQRRGSMSTLGAPDDVSGSQTPSGAATGGQRPRGQSISISASGAGGDTTTIDSDGVEYDADGLPMTKRKTFFIKRSSPTIYVLGGEGVCDAFRLTMTRNLKMNEWRYLPQYCLPESLHTVVCQHSLVDKTCRVWGVHADAVEDPLPQETKITIEVAKRKDEDPKDLVFRDLELTQPPEATRAIPLAAGVASVGHAILCAGGFTNVAAGTLTGDAWLYDCTAQRLLELPPLQVPRSSLCIAIVDRSNALATSWIAYAIGGFNGTRKCNVVERYILGKDCWEVTNPMQHARSGFATCVSDKTVFALGGRSGYGIVATCESMHAQTNQWAPIAPMKLARAMHSAIVYEGSVVVVGGWTGYEWTGSCERYDINHDKWVTICQLPVPMGHAMLALGDIQRDEAVVDEQFG